MKGVLFGNKHSFDDWGLLLKSRSKISPPDAKTVYIDVPSSDGMLDLTESLTDDVKYKNRTITCEFTVIDGRDRWAKIYSDIQDFLQGQQLKVVMEDDDSFYYVGRWAVNEWKSDKVTSTIVIEGNVEPYKMEQYSSLEDWEWDPFDFEIGIIREYKNLEINGSLELIIPARRKRIIPTFNVIIPEGSSMNVSYKGITYSLQNGRNRILTLILPEGDNVLNFTGTGTVSVDYRGGRL